MSQQAQVGSVQAPVDLRTGLARYSGDTRAALDAAALELERTLQWLAERIRYWQEQIRRRREALAQARAGLALCLATAAVTKSSCSTEASAVTAAAAALRQAEEELKVAQHWMRQVQEAAASYRRAAARLASMLDNELPRATALLGRQLAALDVYAAEQAPHAQPEPPTDSTASAPTISAGAGASVLGAGLAPVLAAFLSSPFGDAPASVVGGTSGSPQAASGPPSASAPAWQPLALPGDDEGFSDAFVLPVHGLLVLQERERGSSSSVPERLAALLAGLALAPVLALAVIVHAGSDLADVYRRTAEGTWAPEHSNISLGEALTSLSPIGGQRETAGRAEPERGPEWGDRGYGASPEWGGRGYGGGPERGG